MLLVLLERREKMRLSSKKAKQKLSPHRMWSMKRWNVWAALHRPKDMKGNSNRPKGVVIAVFCISSGWTGI
jgi:hypothetical protein